MTGKTLYEHTFGQVFADLHEVDQAALNHVASRVTAGQTYMPSQLYDYAWQARGVLADYFIAMGDYENAARIPKLKAWADVSLKTKAKYAAMAIMIKNMRTPALAA